MIICIEKSSVSSSLLPSSPPTLLHPVFAYTSPLEPLFCTIRVLLDYFSYSTMYSESIFLRYTERVSSISSLTFWRTILTGGSKQNVHLTRVLVNPRVIALLTHARTAHLWGMNIQQRKVFTIVDSSKNQRLQGEQQTEQKPLSEAEMVPLTCPTS